MTRVAVARMSRLSFCAQCVRAASPGPGAARTASIDAYMSGRGVWTGVKGAPWPHPRPRRRAAPRSGYRCGTRPVSAGWHDVELDRACLQVRRDVQRQRGRAPGPGPLAQRPARRARPERRGRDHDERRTSAGRWRPRRGSGRRRGGGGGLSGPVGAPGSQEQAATYAGRFMYPVWTPVLPSGQAGT